MKKKNESKYFPILINLNKFKALVIGGGNIATRKVQDLLEFTNDVTIISPAITQTIEKLIVSEKLKYIKRKFKTGDTSNFNLIFAATNNPEIDKIINKECQDSGALLNVADVPELCNFIMPANIKHGDLTLSIASQGKAPFYVKYLKNKLSEHFNESTDIEFEMAALLREKMLQLEVYHDREKRESIINEFLELNINAIQGDIDKNDLEIVILKIIQKYID